MTEVISEQNSAPTVFDQILDASRGAETAAEIDQIARQLGARTGPLGFELNHSRYPFQAADLVLPGPRRLFVHETFPLSRQEEGEDLLRTAGLGFLTDVARTERFTFRDVPHATARVLSHAMTVPNADIISRSFLAPVLRTLFEEKGLVPSQATLTNLVHTERVITTRGSDELEIGPRFVPPYIFEAATTETFVATALRNAVDYGDRVVANLGRDLGSR